MSPDTSFTHSLAILIGIDAYSGGIPRLTTAVNDAMRLAELLRAAHGYETILLTEPATGEPITGARLKALFTEELKARLGDDDRLLVYFAGHGVALDGDDGPAGYLVPQDARPGDSASMLAMTELHKWLVDLPCRHMLAILDCCFAGAFRWAATRNIGALPDVIHKERYDRYLLSPAWQVLTSAAYDQKALDVLNGKTIGVRESGGKRHSPFAQALIDALEKGDADLVPKGQGDGVITATELYLYLREQVEVQAEAQASHEQTPGLWPLNKHRKGEFIFLAPGHPLNLPPAPDLTGEANPYRGLKSYDQQHSPLFFGREDEIKELVQQVDQQPFVAVLGASGTGKSSLVKAGLLPRLENPRSDDFSRPAPAEAAEAATTKALYRVLPPMRPTDQPVQALAALLRAELGEDLSGLQDLKGLAGDDALAQIIARWSAAHPGQRLALTIDQFEELATLCLDDPDREHFLRLLADGVQQHHDVFRLIITLRTDFEPQFTQKGSPLAGAWQSARYVVPPMDIEDLRQVIEGPASVRVLYFDPPELVDDLIKEVIQTPGALPLLSFTLSELYVKYVRSGRDDRALSGADYRALGGVVGSLRNRANEEYDALPDDAHRMTMQRAMLRMIAVEGGELARRRVALSELAYPTNDENARVQTVLDRLVDARLLVRGTSDNPNGVNGEAYVEPAHDALVLAWDKLLRWKKEAEEYLPLQRRLAQAATEWGKAEPDAKSGLLWDDDPRLPQVEDTLWPSGGKRKGLVGRLHWEWRVLFPPKAEAPDAAAWVNQAELEFVRASVNERSGFRQRLFGAVAVFVVLVSVLGGLAWWQRGIAVTNEQIAKERQVEAELQASIAHVGELSAESQSVAGDSPQLALLLAAEAVTKSESLGEENRIVKAEQALIDALSMAGGSPLAAQGSQIYDLVFSEDGRWLAAQSTWDTPTRVWDLDTDGTGRPRPRWISRSPLPSDTDAVAGEGKLVPPEGAIPDQPPSEQGGPEYDNPLSPSDSVVPPLPPPISGEDPDEGPALSLPGGDPSLPPSDPRGGSEVGPAILSQDSSVPLTLPNDPMGPGHQAEFSPDGRFVAVYHVGDDRVRLWSIEAGLTTAVPALLEGAAIAGAFSPDSCQLATGDDAGVIRVWNVCETYPPVMPVTWAGHAITVTAVAFSPDGRWLATAAKDEDLRLWDMSQGQPNTNPSVLENRVFVNDLEFSADGRWLLASAYGEYLRVWLITNLVGEDRGTVVEPLLQQDANRFASSRDGRLLVSIHNSGATSVSPRRFEAIFFQLEPEGLQPELVGECSFFGDAESVTISQDGRWVAVTQEDGAIVLLDTASADICTEHSVGAPNGPLTTVLFSPDSRWLAARADYQQIAHLWQLPLAIDGAEPVVLYGHDESITAAAFSTDSRWLATGGFDGEVRLWDLASPATGAALPVTLEKGYDPCNARCKTIVTPDSKWIATPYLRGDSEGIAFWEVGLHARAEPAFLCHRGPDFWRFREILDMVYNAQARLLAIQYGDGNLDLFDVDLSNQTCAHKMVLEQDDWPWPDSTPAGFSRDGRWLILQHMDSQPNQLWDMAGDVNAGTILCSTSSLPDGALLAGQVLVGGLLFGWGSDGSGATWCRERLLGSAADSVVSYNQQWGVMTTSDGNPNEAGIWDINFFNPQMIRRKTADIVFAIDSVGQWIAFGDAHKSYVSRLDPVGAEMPPYQLEAGEYSSAAFSEDGLWFAAINEQGSIRLLRMNESAPSAPLHLDMYPNGRLSGTWIGAGVSFSPDSQWLIGSSTNAVKLWPLAAQTWINQACEIAARPLTLDEMMLHRRDMSDPVTCRE